ncbi:MAG TPA: response regulator [Nitrospirae bacterium]|nr:hypothetical protein BMS3Abin10_02194 [bacterium BMS3Abin10]GBE38741.1 hypothetical protein BMS3Bbin08_01351 [bacterium BMS3Bbin08]HDH51473.1 response regulator [Nitrospirota bacterium]HDK16684.1 response regulator [Nitrospirota bacterium]HDK41560.1 response regulator [Nitrospirota bacterium]
MPSVLVVEDSPTMRQLITFALKRLPDCSITEAANGMEALDKLSSTTFDLILADINMPVMDGLKLVGLLRSDPRHKETPIIIITTEGAEEDKNRAMEIGANAYLTKPIHTNELLKRVSEYIG